MKHLKRMLLALFCAVFAFSAVAFSACDDATNGNEPSNIANGDSGSEGATGNSGSGTGSEGSGSASGDEGGSGDSGSESGGNPETPAGPFTVTVGNYDTEKGTVSVSAPK